METAFNPIPQLTSALMRKTLSGASRVTALVHLERDRSRFLVELNRERRRKEQIKPYYRYVYGSYRTLQMRHVKSGQVMLLDSLIEAAREKLENPAVSTLLIFVNKKDIHNWKLEMLQGEASTISGASIGESQVTLPDLDAESDEPDHANSSFDHVTGDACHP